MAVRAAADANAVERAGLAGIFDRFSAFAAKRSSAQGLTALACVRLWRELVRTASRMQAVALRMGGRVQGTVLAASLSVWRSAVAKGLRVRLELAHVHQLQQVQNEWMEAAAVRAADAAGAATAAERVAAAARLVGGPMAIADAVTCCKPISF